MVAGAGSGKTRPLACRVAHLLASGVMLRRLLGRAAALPASGQHYRAPRRCRSHALTCAEGIGLKPSLRMARYRPAWVAPTSDLAPRA
ncbi:MAG: hypothetical protein LC808_25035 [Actinobacteria bacterium]|nr:hypothetical protein [Actinomycetota bacterium]